ncbi:MAG: hypothetical protein ACR2HT_04635 [Pyrinomonadaceae bacterium]
MFKLSDIGRKTILLVYFLVGLIAVIALILIVQINSQQSQVFTQKEKDKLIKQIESSAEVPFNVVGNDDSPFRIVEAKTKEISGVEFTRLTQKTTDFSTVMSVPEVKLMNTSGKTITSFYLLVHNAETHSARGFINSAVSIAPGETYIITRDYFAKPKKSTVSDSNGAEQNREQTEWDSEEFWLKFNKSPDVFVTVGQVTFQDGSQWVAGERERVK